MSTQFNRDRLTNIDPTAAANAVMRVVDVMQDQPPEAQVAGMVAAAMLVAETHGIKATEAFAIVNNVMHHADGRRPEFAAARQYMEEELT